MSKEEILKIKKCVLKVNIHCHGCQQKVKKILKKIDAVFITDIDADQGKVIVTGNVEPAVLIKKLAKSGKHAELWSAPKPNNHNNQGAKQFKNMQVDNGKGSGGGNNKGPKGGNNQPKGGQQGQQEDDLTDYEFDEDDIDDDCDDPEVLLNKMKPAMANGQRPNMMLNGMMNGYHPQLMVAKQGGNAGGNGNKDFAPVPCCVGGANNGKNGTGGKRGGGGGGKYYSQGGGKQNDRRIRSNNEIGGEKSNGMSERPHSMSNGFQTMNRHAAMAPAGKMGAMDNMNSIPVAFSAPMGQMGSIPAVQGLPALAMNGGTGGGYFPGARPDAMAGNTHHHHYFGAMMNQPRSTGNDSFQTAVNYMPPYPYTPHPPADPYTHYFSDENTTSSCSVM